MIWQCILLETCMHAVIIVCTLLHYNIWLTVYTELTIAIVLYMNMHAHMMSILQERPKTSRSVRLP